MLQLEVHSDSTRTFVKLTAELYGRYSYVVYMTNLPSSQTDYRAKFGNSPVNEVTRTRGPVERVPPPRALMSQNCYC